MTSFSSIKAVLFDLDGVLYVGKQPIMGAIEAVKNIRNAGYACRFVTNTSTLSLASLQHKLDALGFLVTQKEIMSAPQAAVQYLQQQATPICRLLLADDVKQDFMHFPQSDTEANFIVVGDIGDAWNYQMLNEVFSCLMRGAKLIAIHKNRFWQTENGLQMDIGAFIAGLEYAASTQAMLIGKPSADFFNMALADLNLQPNEVLMVGDDIDSDIGGAQASGLRGVLVRTGKYRQAYTDKSVIKPDAVIDTVADLPALLASTQ
ncbi:MAG TPA: TIGR01458 family HAD-type hydrolase [Methylophilus sp.]|nr:TIGR01458 family HAD-type hydrolase [Methylophilus sp.]HQQ34163.1 TIGR01458 family HAD-type hydrolase [Methylophilus sp.]